MSAVLSIRRLKAGASRYLFAVTSDELDFSSTDVVEAESCSVEVEVDKSDGSIVVRGRVEANVLMDCARCLEPVHQSVVQSFALVLRLVRGGEVSGPEAESGDDFIVLPEHTEEFDLLPIVRERIILALPLKPLCREDCRGLCPRCGANRNTESCDCTDERQDERWSQLRKLKEQSGGNQDATS
jgi:uncharacterized protein